MKRRKSWLLIACLLFMTLMLGACSSEDLGGIKVEADLTTDPVSVKVNEDVRLTTNVTGLKTFDDVEVYFEVKNPDQSKRELVRVDKSNNGTYSGPTKFVEEGTHEVIVHVINPDIHATIKKSVEVGK